MQRIRLIAITDFDRVRESVLFSRAERLAGTAAPGTVAFQLRDRTRTARELLTLGARLRGIARGSGQSFIVNDRLDLALILEADAVHLGESSIATRDARRLFRQGLVYRACHDPEGVTAIDADGVLLSPAFAPRKGNPALGLAALERASEQIRRSGQQKALFALGGVDAGNARACMSAGADGVAAIGAAFDGDDPSALLAALSIVRASSERAPS